MSYDCSRKSRLPWPAPEPEFHKTAVETAGETRGYRAECRGELPGRNYIRPPPPPPFLAKRHFSGEGGCIFQGRGVGVYILSPHAAGILYAPPFYTPPTPRRVFSGVGGAGVYKIRPCRTAWETAGETAGESCCPEKQRNGTLSSSTLRFLTLLRRKITVP